MDGSLVCIHFAMSNLPGIGIEMMARDELKLQEDLERNGECCSASLWCLIQDIIWR